MDCGTAKQHQQREHSHGAGHCADVVGWILWDGLYGEKKRCRQQWKLLYESYRPCHGVLVIIHRY